MNKYSIHHFSVFKKKNIWIDTFYSADHSKSCIIVPGDTTSSLFYYGLADICFNKGINCFIMNYFDLKQDNMAQLKTLTNEHYVELLKLSESMILQKFSIKDLLYVGHSRGTYVIQKYLETPTRKGCKAVLFSPLFVGKEFPFYPISLKMAMQVLPQFFKSAVKFNEKFYTQYFFNQSPFSEEQLKKLFAFSLPVPIKLLRKPKIIHYDRYPANVTCEYVAGTTDLPLPVEYCKTCVEILRHNNKNSFGIFYQTMPGSHFACIEAPTQSAAIILNAIAIN